MLGALLVSGLLAGCATPIGIRIADPLEVQRYLTRSALTDQHPSDFSQNALRRYDLLQEYDSDPDAALIKLHAAALAEDLPPAILFALAELSFLRAQETELQAGYAAALIYAYARLFPEQRHATTDLLDPRERIAADLYNRALTSTFRRTEQGTLDISDQSEVRLVLPFGTLTVTRASDLLEKNGVSLHDLQPVAEIEIRGLRNRYRRPGVGAPLGAKMTPLPGVVPAVPIGENVLEPLTAVVFIDSPLEGLRNGDVHGRIEMFASSESEMVEIGGREFPLEAEPSAALAAALTESQFWKRELQSFLGNAFGVRKESALGALRPYKQGRIPVVFVHGTASSSARWANMINDLLSERRLRDRYDFWFFTYDSGNPIGYSGYQLRDELIKAVERADPSGSDPCLRDMVVLGHSQGGLLTKMTAIDAGDRFWENVSNTPFDELQLPPEDEALLRDLVFVTPLPFVSEVIFLATPQRGSYLAGPQFVRRVAAYFVRLPSSVLRIGADLASLSAADGSEIVRNRMPTSIDNMSPGNAFIETLSEIPVDPAVTAHSIIAVASDDPLERAGDGVVKYQSAHIEDVESELIVHSPHSGMQDKPETVEEVRRILRQHSERSACPR